MSTVLYVEDDDNNAFMLTHRLRRHGVRVQHVGDGERALVAAAWDPPAAVLLDVNLPGMDGLAVLRRLRSDAATRTLPVIVVSASVREQDRAKALDAGADAFVAKPIDFPRLLDVLSRWIAVGPGSGGHA
ncbi:MAG TPA: response regulator [Dyella sp.]|nr:response regulator [Dyella sp.]